MASYTPGAPLLFGLSRYTAEAGWRILINGHHLSGATRVELNGVAIPQADVTPIGYHRLAIVVPHNATSGTIRVITPLGHDTSRFVLHIGTPRPSSGGSAPPPPGGGSGSGGSPNPPSSSDGDIDFAAAIRQIGQMAPRSLRPTFNGLGNIVQGIQSSYSSRPFARGGNWIAYSAERSSVAQWRRAQANAERLRPIYEQRLQNVTSNPSAVDFESMSDDTLNRIASQSHANLPNNHSLRYERGRGWVRTNSAGREFNVRGGRLMDDLRQSGANDLADQQRQHLQNRINQLNDIVSQRGRAAAGAVATGGMTGFGIGQGIGTSGVLSGIGGMIGTSVGGPVGTIVGSMIGGLIERIGQVVLAGIRRVGTNILRGGDLGDSIVGSLLNGFRSAGRDAWNAGTTLAESVLEGLVTTIGPQMGPGGQGVLRFGGQALRGVGNILEAGVSGGAGLVRGVGRVAGIGIVGAAALGGAGAGAMLASGGGMMGGAAVANPVVGAGMLGAMPVGAMIGAVVASALAVVAMRIVAALAEIAGNLLETFGRIFGELGGMAAGFIRTVVGLIDEARQAFSRYAESAIRINSLSGISLHNSQRLINTRQAFGMSQNDVSGAYSQFSNMPQFQAGMKRAWGIEGMVGSDEEFNSILNRARSLPLMLRRVMLQNMPEGEDFWARLVGMPQDKINSQLQFFQNFEMPDGQMKSMADNLLLLTQRWEGFYSFVMRTLGSALMPMLTRAMAGITTYLKMNQGSIVDWIVNIGRWFYVSLPSYIGRGVEMILTLFMRMINGITTALRTLRHSLGPILDFMDALMLTVFNGFQNVLNNVLRNLILTGIRTMLLNIVPSVITLIPGIGPTAAAAARRAIQAVNVNQMQLPRLADQHGLHLAAIRNLGHAENEIRRFTAPFMRAAQQGINWAQEQRRGEGQRGLEYDQFTRLTGALEENTQALRNGQNIQLDVEINPVEDFYAKVTAHMVEGDLRDLARRG